MNGKTRAEMVKAMDVIARSLNDDDMSFVWLMGGVADCDIMRETTLDEIIELGYCEDKTFKDLMSLFLRLMYRAYITDTGLYTDRIVSKTKKDYENE